MNRIRSCLSSAATAFGAWLMLEDHAWARGPGQEDSSWPFVGSYAIVALLVTLGLLVVCQGGNRADEPPITTRFDD